MKIPRVSTNYSKKEHITVLSLLLLVTFTSFILIIVGTAGSSSDYVPITNIYLGNADIQHINVTKVIPQLGPILAILGTALTAPNRTLDNIFSALKTVADTPALTPLMYLLSNAENITGSLHSLTELAPLALTGDPISDTQELIAISALLRISDNGTETLMGLKELVEPMLVSAANSSSGSAAATDNTTAATMQLLQMSSDPETVAKSLAQLNGLTPTDKMQMLPVFTLFAQSSNASAVVASLAAIMQNAKEVSAEKSQLLLTTLQSMLARNDNVTQVFGSVGSLASSDAERQSIAAIGELLGASTNVNGTLSALERLVESNVTQSETAAHSLTALSGIIGSVNDTGKAVSTVAQLAANTDTAATTQQLQGLQMMLDATDKDAQTVAILAQLQSNLNPNSTTYPYIPSLFNLLAASKNPPVTFSSLVTLTSWAQQNPTTFLPIMAILNDAMKVEMISPETLLEMTPTLLEYLEIPVNFHLSIFTLCKADINNTVLRCSASHAVQNMDFRNIIYVALMESQFQPYLKALDIGADDLYLEGKLLDREHEYVPAIKAVLAMNILAIIFSFITMINIGFLCWMKWSTKGYAWCLAIGLASATALFSGLGTTVLTVVLQIIKSGTYDDQYGVVFTTGTTYAAMTWCAFAFLVIVCFALLWCGWNERDLILPLGRRSSAKDLENGSSDSDMDSDSDSVLHRPEVPSVTPGQVMRHSSNETSASSMSEEKVNNTPNINTRDSSSEET
ncbi:Fat3 protein [Maudiozyma humilis]|uniref:Fat3 protein n=1 Tax=Maudiozyma humilis TaxID=51915 RepID=A0AAV5RQD1_MAUHU|nr:Fat3 protein [Kazachstania humilis]